MPFDYSGQQIIEDTVARLNATIKVYEDAREASHANAVRYSEVEQSITSRKIAAQLACEIETMRIGAQQFGVMPDFKYFDVTFDSRGLMVRQKRRNEQCPAPQFETWPESNWRAGATINGIIINGDFGTNPPRDMMLETAQVLQLLVESWKQLREEAQA